MTDTYLAPAPEQIQALMAAAPEGPIVMLNLLKFRANGGVAAYAKYGQLAGPFLAKAGASVRYLGDVTATVIGGDAWDEAILVEYPSLQAFIDMTSDPDYPSEARTAALEDSRLYCMSDRTS